MMDIEQLDWKKPASSRLLHSTITEDEEGEKQPSLYKPQELKKSVAKSLPSSSIGA